MEKRNAIWITSYPKSGNTWIHSVLRLAGKSYGFPQIDMDVYNILKKGEQPIICPAVNDRFTNNPCVVLKTHSAYKKEGQLHCFSEMELVNVAYVHIYRNPLDVLLSYLNFSRLEYKAHENNAIYKKNLFENMLGLQMHYQYEEWLGMNLEAIPQKNLDHALDYFSDNGLSLTTLTGMSGSWIDNTQSWVDAAKIIPGHTIRYEDCLEDPEQFVKLCDLFMFDRKNVLHALDYVNTRAHSMSTSGNQDQAVFYNKMSAYYFTDYFSKEAIARFLNKNEATLQRFGYSSIFELI
jgi:Sulfotransferase domain